MDSWGLLKWRRTLGYTQAEAGEKLGVNRGTIQNWERGNTRIPKSIELACQELARQWKQSSLPFVAVWYGGTIALCTLAGARLGPRLLRW
jgi:DNA-binding XRE family transcriptional regulator